MTNPITLPPAKSITFEFMQPQSINKRSLDIVLIALTALTLIVQLINLFIHWKNRKISGESSVQSVVKAMSGNPFGNDLEYGLANSQANEEQPAQSLQRNASS